jgi:hypothetical protein
LCSVVETVVCSIGRDSVAEESIVAIGREVVDMNKRDEIDQIQSVLRKEVHPEVNFLDIKRGSIRCYMLCRTQVALKTLHEKLENGSLTSTMESIFGLLLSPSSVSGRPLVRIRVTEISGCVHKTNHWIAGKVDISKFTWVITFRHHIPIKMTLIISY